MKLYKYLLHGILVGIFIFHLLLMHKQTTLIDPSASLFPLRRVG